MSQDEVTNYGGDLIPSDSYNAGDDSGVLAVASANGGGFLPRLQLYGGTSGPCKEGKIGMGHFGIVRAKETIEDLGKEVNVLVVASKPQAMRITEGKVLTYFDHTSPEFKQIQDESADMNSGCMFGPVFLLYVPAAKTFVTYFMQSKTARRVAGDLHALTRKSATIKGELIKTAKHSWHGPKVTPNSSPIELPELAEIQEQAEKFLGQKSSSTVKAAVDEDVVR